MSFLNPVNEPVLRFKSTDAGAPQINYNARVAGDVKAVLKACLVTGYGATASAGWSIVNEVDHVAEFVSPSAAMSDYRLGIDDTSASSTTWYYQYQDARVNPVKNTINKVIGSIDKTHSTNGWQLLVTPRGIVFIEFFYSTVVSALVSRVTYYGQIKSGLVNSGSKNVAFWNIGHDSNTSQPFAFFSATSTTDKHFNLSSYTALTLAGATASVMSSDSTNYNSLSGVSLAAPIYLVANNNSIVAEHPAVLAYSNPLPSDRYGVFDTTVNSRPVLSTPLTWNAGSASTYEAQTRVFLIYLDYWEY